MGLFTVQVMHLSERSAWTYSWFKQCVYQSAVHGLIHNSNSAFIRAQYMDLFTVQYLYQRAVLGFNHILDSYIIKAVCIDLRDY